MAQALIKLGEHEDRVLQIVKGKYGLKNKSEAVNFVIKRFEEEFLEPELRPEYEKKINEIRRQKGTRYKSVKALRDDLRHA